MTVQEMIEELQKQAPNDEVSVYDQDNCLVPACVTDFGSDGVLIEEA